MRWVERCCSASVPAWSWPCKAEQHLSARVFSIGLILSMHRLLQVKEVMCHLLREAARGHPEPWSILMSTYASTPLPLRCTFAEVATSTYCSSCGGRMALPSEPS